MDKIEVFSLVVGQMVGFLFVVCMLVLNQGQNVLNLLLLTTVVFSKIPVTYWI